MNHHAIVTIKFWWPGVFRASILCALAYLVAFDSSYDQIVNKISSTDTQTWGNLEWFKFLYPLLGKPMIAVLITLKSFMDDTWSKLRQQHDTGFTPNT